MIERVRLRQFMAAGGGSDERRALVEDLCVAGMRRRDAERLLDVILEASVDIATIIAARADAKLLQAARVGFDESGEGFNGAFVNHDTSSADVDEILTRALRDAGLIAAEYRHGPRDLPGDGPVGRGPGASSRPSPTGRLLKRMLGTLSALSRGQS